MDAMAWRISGRGKDDEVMSNLRQPRNMFYNLGLNADKFHY